ncbi:MAG: hypothetical protein U5N21_14530 [Rhodococcus sp. (in: high G+C Gram-positive bacteria)]|nr:hypothetical protein [Rhodococcus sp. (in: high G+C Gram-positive bacteria)]
MGSTRERVDARSRSRVADADRLTAAVAEREQTRQRFVAARAQRDAATAAMAGAFGRLVELTGSREVAASVAGITEQEADSVLRGVDDTTRTEQEGED